jgi:hypothetical protein
MLLDLCYLMPSAVLLAQSLESLLRVFMAAGTVVPRTISSSLSSSIYTHILASCCSPPTVPG